MRILRGVVPALVVVTLVTAACGGDPEVTAPPSATPSPTPTPTPAITEIPFAAAAFPASGSACDAEGYAGRLGRVEAVNARTVRFELCAPDAAFLARLAHPVAGVLDATSFASLARDPDVRPTLAGTGPYVVDRWVPGENVLLSRAGPEAAPDAVSPVMVVAWDADAAARTAALEDATIDGVDAPGPAELDQIATLPELVVTDQGRPRDRVPRVRRGAGLLGRRGPAGDRRVARPGRARHRRVPRRHDRSVAPHAVHRRWRLRGARLVRVQRAGRRRRRSRPRGSTSTRTLPAPRPRRPGPRPAGSGGRRGGREGPAGDEPRPEGHGGRHARRGVPRGR